MKIGIIGAGNIGGTLARSFIGAGHDVRIANSRGPDTLAEVAHETGAMPATIEDAIMGADAIIVAVPYKAIRQLPATLFETVPDSVAIIDTGNYYPIRDGVIGDLDGPIADTEWVARHFGRPVIKAFNSISVNSLRSREQSVNRVPGSRSRSQVMTSR